jgi:hypothetical protein
MTLCCSQSKNNPLFLFRGNHDIHLQSIQLNDIRLVELMTDVERAGTTSMDGIDVRDIVKRAMLAGTTSGIGEIGEDDCGVGGGSMVELMNDDEADEARRYFGVL